MSLRVIFCAAIALAMLVDWSTAQPVADKDALLNEYNMMTSGGDDDASVFEKNLLSLLAGRRLVKRLRNQADIDDLQRKRNYWRQCAFNAVSCFGK